MEGMWDSGRLRRPPPADRETEDGRPSIRRNLEANARRSYRRHGEPGWPEWALRELLRLCYVIFVMAVLILGALQIEYSLVPDNAPPLLDPGLVIALALVFAVGVIAAAAVGYFFLWREDGYVDRWVARRGEAAASASAWRGRRG